MKKLRILEQYLMLILVLERRKKFPWKLQLKTSTRLLATTSWHSIFRTPEETPSEQHLLVGKPAVLLYMCVCVRVFVIELLVVQE